MFFLSFASFLPFSFFILSLDDPFLCSLRWRKQGWIRNHNKADYRNRWYGGVRCVSSAVLLFASFVPTIPLQGSLLRQSVQPYLSVWYFSSAMKLEWLSVGVFRAFERRLLLFLSEIESIRSILNRVLVHFQVLWRLFSIRHGCIRLQCTELPVGQENGWFPACGFHILQAGRYCYWKKKTVGFIPLRNIHSTMADEHGAQQACSKTSCPSALLPSGSKSFTYLYCSSGSIFILIILFYKWSLLISSIVFLSIPQWIFVLSIHWFPFKSLRCFP